MTELSIQPGKKISADAIERLCCAVGLTITMKGSLKSIDENTHWHFKNGKQKGVLEITLIKATGEIILSVHKTRRGEWEEEMMNLLKEKIIT